MSISSNMVLIETKTVGAGGSSTIDFTGIPTTGYTDLQIVFSTRSSYDNIYVPWTGFYVTANGSTSGYSGRMLEGNGSSAYSQTNNVSTAWEYAASNDSATTSNTFSSGTIYIPNYAGSTYKSLSMDKVTENNATGASQTIYAGLWSNTAAINRITFTEPNGTFIEGSTASLYGIKSLNKNVGPKATGGIITTAGGYAIHTFYSSGTFTPTQALTNVEYLVIAGGGGGGASNYGSNAASGGGGAGGYRSSVTGESSGGGASAESKLSLSSGVGYTVTVGAGGNGSSSVSSNPSNGSDSTFSTITATGGGRGTSGETASSGGSGGSGGGGAYRYGTSSGGAGTANQGYAGGSTSTNINVGGGGGGAGAAGVQQSPGTSPAIGGVGVSSSITGTAVTRANGGRGVWDGAGFADAASNTGDGGAGYTTSSSPNRGANGGSGIVIVRYAI